MTWLFILKEDKWMKGLGEYYTNLRTLPGQFCLLIPGFHSCGKFIILLASLSLFLASKVCSQTDDTPKQMFWLHARTPT